MAFKLDDLLRRGPEIWTYRTTDSLSTVLGAGYFNAALDKMEAGDQILVSVLSDLNATPGTTASLQRPLLVTGLSAGAVSVALADGGIPTGYINVLDYGADPTGVADSTAALVAAEAAAYTAGGGVIHVPPGNIKFTSTVTIRSGVRIKGTCNYASRLTYAPTLAGTGLLFSQGASGVFNAGLADVRIICDETSLTKTIIGVIDGRECVFERFIITNSSGLAVAGGDTCGFMTNGREKIVLRDYEIAAPRPVVFGVNPNTSNGDLSVDHFTLTNSYLRGGSVAPTTKPDASIHIETGAVVHNLVIDGAGAATNSAEFLHFVHAAAQTVARPSQTISISGVRTETGRSASAYSVVIDTSGASAPGLKTLRLDSNIWDDSRNGLNLNYVEDVVETCGLYLHGSGSSATALMTLKDCQSVTWNNVSTAATSKDISLDSGMRKIWEMPKASYKQHPHVARWGLKNTGAAGVLYGTGSPNGAVEGTIGDQYIDLNGGAGATLYVKESGNWTTSGWAAK